MKSAGRGPTEAERYASGAGSTRGSSAGPSEVKSTTIGRSGRSGESAGLSRAARPAVISALAIVLAACAPPAAPQGAGGRTDRLRPGPRRRRRRSRARARHGRRRRRDRPHGLHPGRLGRGDVHRRGPRLFPRARGDPRLHELRLGNGDGRSTGGRPARRRRRRPVAGSATRSPAGSRSRSSPTRVARRPASATPGSSSAAICGRAACDTGRPARPRRPEHGRWLLDGGGARPGVRDYGLTTADVDLLALPFPDMAAALANRSADAVYPIEPFVVLPVEQGSGNLWAAHQRVVPRRADRRAALLERVCRGAARRGPTLHARLPAGAPRLQRRLPEG